MSNPEFGPSQAETEMSKTPDIDLEVRLLKTDLDSKNWTEVRASLTSELQRAVSEEKYTTNDEKKLEIKTTLEKVEAAIKTAKENGDVDDEYVTATTKAIETIRGYLE